MTDYPHLPFRRVARPQAPRRKRKGAGGGGRYPDPAAHAKDIERAADAAVEAFAVRREQITDFDPKLILRIDLGARVPEEEFARAGLTVLDSTERNVSVVFADDVELRSFRERLEGYRQGRRARPGEEELGSAMYEGFFDAIDALRMLTPEDRISARLAEELTGDDPILFDVEFWFVPDQEKLERWLEEARERVEQLGGEWLDEFVSPRAGVAVARCRGVPAAVRGVAELDQVAVVDRVPQPRITSADLAALQDIERLNVEEPEAGAPIVGVIDSGVRAGHPLLEPALVEATALHEEFGGQGEDDAGHGTGVAGIALYGDVEAAARIGTFTPPFWIASVRVLDGSARVPEAASFLRVISDAVEYLAETWEARVINISIGDSDSPYSGGKSTPLAAALDTLARRFDLVIVVSAGNLSLTDLQPHNEAADTFPVYLSKDGYEVLDPAQAALALTVGGVTAYDGVAPRLIGSLEIGCVAPAGGPAPFTRRGPGAQRALKPELAAESGNLAYDSSMQRLRQEVAASVVTTSSKYPERLFEVDVGTSLAAACITNLAGRLLVDYPGLSANAVRALLLQGADHADSAKVIGEHYPDNEVEARTLEVVGYGVPDWSRVGNSQENRVVMYAEDHLRPDDFHVYRIPMTDGFIGESGPHELTVSLAFDPPVRHRRFDYLAYRMEFVVVRGIDLAQVYELAGVATEDGPTGALRRHEVAMRPTRTDRGRGTNQAARLRLEQRPQSKWSDDWYVVVRSVNRWMDAEAEPQPYALSVTLGAERATNLYGELEARLQAEIEVELGAET